MGHITNGKDILHFWDNSSRSDRKKLLAEFIKLHVDLTGPELDDSLEHTAPLLLARLTASLRLTYLSISESLFEQIQSVEIFLKSAGGLSFVEQFIDVGGPLALLDIIALKQTPEHCKTQALQTLQILADRGLRYKAILCESNAIKITTECLAKSDNENTRLAARELLLELGTIPPNNHWGKQVYIALIALLASKSPRANHLAIGSLQIIQPVVKFISPGLAKNLLNLLDTPHLEVLLEACVFTKSVLNSDYIDKTQKHEILNGLVEKLAPSKENYNFDENLINELNILNDNGGYADTEILDLKHKSYIIPVKQPSLPMPLLLGQAGAARCIGMLINNDKNLAKQLLNFNVIKNLIFAAGQTSYSESRRMSFKAIKIYCDMFPDVKKIVKGAMGSKLFEKFYNNDDVWAELGNIDIDILVNNRAIITERELLTMDI